MYINKRIYRYRDVAIDVEFSGHCHCQELCSSSWSLQDGSFSVNISPRSVAMRF